MMPKSIPEESNSAMIDGKTDDLKLSVKDSFTLENLCNPGMEMTEFHIPAPKLEVLQDNLYDENSEFTAQVRNEFMKDPKYSPGFFKFNNKKRVHRLMKNTRIKKTLFGNDADGFDTRNDPAD